MADFEKLFTQRAAQAISPQARGAKDEDWADVTLPSTNGRQASAMAPTTMPSLDELPRPEILFASQIPYHLIVKVVHDGMVVQGSHQGSLELLARYLQKHTRNVENVSIKVSPALCIRQHIPAFFSPSRQGSNRTLILAQLPVFRSELQVSHLGYGGLFDSIAITPGDSRIGRVDINPVLVLSFVEGVLGYSPVASASSESQWYFKRDVGFEE